ncbi:MFS general substrate transporter [Lactifluus subvellereus]|nr:MFS general substrate transporter [Lactifluus subvellereus]
MSAESAGDRTNGVCNLDGSHSDSLSKAFQSPRPSPTPLSEKPARGTKINGADQPYSVFTHREKWFIVGIASYAALFSPLTANIYFPAIPVMSRDFHKNVELINLTVTMYMVMQGISPMIWGTLSDRWGRRPMMFACLATLSLSCVGLALVPTSAYWLLMLLRCLQAAGSASTVALGTYFVRRASRSGMLMVALGSGIIADVATPAERGGFFGAFGLGPMFGPTLGPVIGGGLAQGLGWRAIFWFLCIGSATCGLGLFLFLPETLRAIVGDGSIPAGWIYTPPIPIIGRHRMMNEFNERPPRKPFTNPLLMLLYPDVFVLLVFNGTYFAVMYGVSASLSIIFERVYPYLNQTDIGLCFLAMGGGMFIGTSVSGKFLNSHYRKVRDDLTRRTRIDSEKGVDPEALGEEQASFPIERARLQGVQYVVVVYATCVIGYGWSLQSRVSIAVPLILQFIIGALAITMMNAVQALLVDLVPSQGSSITACNNIVRCLMGAGMVSIMNPMLVALGDGWTYTLLGGLCLVASPLVFVEVKWGPTWRERRRQKQESAVLHSQ